MPDFPTLSELYEADLGTRSGIQVASIPGDPTSAALVTIAEGQPIGHLTYNREALDALIRGLTEFRAQMQPRILT